MRSWNAGRLTQILSNEDGFLFRCGAPGHSYRCCSNSLSGNESEKVGNRRQKFDVTGGSILLGFGETQVRVVFIITVAKCLEGVDC